MRLSGGSAVVRMRSTTQAATAIAALNGAVPEGGWQQLTVRSAETAEQRSSRITAINGRQTGPGSPMQQLAGPGAPLPPSGPGAALRRVHSARGTGSQGTLHSSYPSMGDDMQAHQQPQRRSVDWAGVGAGSSMHSMHSSRRSSMDAMRTNARCSSDSGSGSIDELPALAASEELPSGDLQRMLLEAVLALVGQVEGGQLSLVSGGCPPACPPARPPVGGLCAGASASQGSLHWSFVFAGCGVCGRCCYEARGLRRLLPPAAPSLLNSARSALCPCCRAPCAWHSSPR